MTDHGQRAHALLSASGSSRWLNCTPSARMEEDFEDTTDSPFAAEGTLAHEFGDIGLKVGSGQITEKEFYEQYEKLSKSEFYNEEMDEEVAKYVDYVMEEFNAAKTKTPGAVLLIEQSVDLAKYIPEGYGSNDAIIIADGTMEVIDLKYGRGLRVDAVNNSQLMLYGLGALEKYELSYDIEKVKLTIFQPRLDNSSSWIIDAEELRQWGENKVKAQAEKAYKGEGEVCAGAWCKWCKAKVRCKALAEKANESAKHDFADPKLLSDEDLLAAFEQAQLVSDWIKSVSDYIKEEAVKGKQWPGYKLVEGRTNRMWGQPYQAFAILQKMVEEGKIKHMTEIQETKLKGITAIEKLLGKEKFSELLGPVVIKPVGAPTLVPETDKRPALGSTQQASSDFNN